MSSPELQQLLQALHDRDIDLRQDDVAWAFDSEGTKGDLKSWIQEYLSPATLLTKEELAFEKRHRDVSRQQKSHVRPVSDQEFESAIDSLEMSAASIEKQCRLLETQKQALREIRTRHSPRTADSPKVQNKSRRELAQLEFEAEELRNSLQTRLETSKKQTSNAAVNVSPAVSRMLERDDRMLDGLEKILLQVSDTNDSGQVSDDVDRLCKALTTQHGAKIRARIDAVFHENTKPTSEESNGTDASKAIQQQQESLRLELDELCREIDGLSMMAVDSQHRVPLTRALATSRTTAAHDKTAWSDYLSTSLQHLTTRLTTLDTQTQHLHAHNSALATLSSTLATTAAALPSKITTTTISNSTTTTARPNSPTKPSQRGLKPLRLVQANLSDSQDPVTQLLRHFGLAPNPETDDPAHLAAKLATALRAKRDSSRSLATQTERGLAELVAGFLARGEGDVEAVVGSVFAFSTYGGVKVVEGEVETGLAGLEEGTQRVGREMRELDLETLVEEVRGALGRGLGA